MVVKKLKKLVSKLVSPSDASNAAVKIEPVENSKEPKKKGVAKEAKAPEKNLKKTSEAELSVQPLSNNKRKENDMSEQSSNGASALKHTYLEVAGELLSKPTTLCDLLESRAAPKTLIFCNSPSDTDFVDVLVRKRGINSTKLIGFVSPEKTSSTMDRLISGDLISVVATDIAARGLDLTKFELIINYSLPQDSGSYEERCGMRSEAPYTGEVISLVSPLDLTSFMQLKKSLNLEPEKIDLPDAKDLSRAKVARLVKSAQAKSAEISENTKMIAQELLKDSNKESVVAYLIAQSFETIPQLQAQIEKLALERELEEDGGQQPGARSNTGRGWGREDRGNDRRGGGRGRDDDRRGGDDRRAGGGEERRGDDRRGNGRGQEGRRRFDDNNQGEQRDEGDRSPIARKQVVRQKDERIYFGQGTTQGFNADKLAELVAKAGLSADAVRRVSVRSTYSFADVGEGVSDTLIPALADVEVGGNKLFCVKAATIVTSEASEAPAVEAGSEGQDDQRQDRVQGDQAASDESAPLDEANT